jgi:DNA adenine methylase
MPAVLTNRRKTALDLSSVDYSPNMKPPLKWAGGKRWLVPHLQKLWHGYSDSRLVEPFVGGLAIALGLQPERALLNDANPHLINFYHWLQRGLRVTFPMRNNRAVFDLHRKRFNAMIALAKADTSSAAGLFYYLNRTGFNGLCRFNSDGHFNVPFGAYSTINYTEDFSAYQAPLGGWDFVQGDFEDLAVESDDFIYADPPYDVEFTQYSKDAFRWEDQVRLAEWLADHPGPVVASNQATGRIIKLYKKLDFKLQFIDAPRRISCNGDRTPAREVLALRNI